MKWASRLGLALPFALVSSSALATPPPEAPATWSYRALAPRDPLVFVADPKMGVETSVRSIDSLGRLFFRYEDALPNIDIDERRFPGKLATFIGRGFRLIFLDSPLAELTTIGVHEAGGHGARARELGLDPTFLFYLPGIYRSIFAPKDNEAIGAYTTYPTRQIVEDPRDVVVTLGGLEANYAHAWWINARIIRARGWAHHGDLLTYFSSKLSYVDSFFSPSIQRLGASSPNDVASYVSNLQGLSNEWTPEDRRRIARRLSAGYLWNLADPTLAYSLYATIVSTLFQGKRVTQMPLPQIGETTLMLSPRFGLTPFGAEQMLDVFLANRGRLLDVYARVGTSGLASYYGAGGRVLGLRVGGRVTLGGELDVWRQPELLLDTRGVFERPSRAGVNAALYGDVRVTKVLSLTAKLGGKTPGYVTALPLDGGPHGYLGVSLAW